MNRTLSFGGMLALAFSATLNLLGQETAVQRHTMATNQLTRLAREMSARCLNEVDSLASWQGRRAELRRQLLEMLGLDPLPVRTPLKFEITGRLERAGYAIEKVVYQSLPGLYVTGSFYVPHGNPGPRPTILYVCGHSADPLGAKVHYQDRAAWFAAHGYACLILDTLEFGEVAGIHHGTHNLNLWHWLSLGYTPAGVEVWNAMRALDYLETRPEVDRQRIGMTGISGGGAITWYTAAVDERVAVAAPVCSTYTFGSQTAHWLASGQCDCIYYHNTYGWDFPVVAALIAPRPLMMISGQKDTIFPPDGYHEVYRRAKRVYDLYAGGDSDRIRELDADVGHSDPPLFLREARQWMRRWLKDDPTPLVDEPEGASELVDARALACLERLPADAVNYRVQHTFTATARLSPAGTRREWGERRAALLGQLGEKVFRWFPNEPVPFETMVFRNSGGYMPRYADYREGSFQSEPGVRIRAQLLIPKRGAAGAPLLIYVKRPGDSIYAMDMDELLPLLDRFTVLILNPRFTELAPGAAEYADLERTAVWLGRTIAAMQVWDVRRAIEWAVRDQRLSPSAISIYGKGDLGIVGLYAAVMDDRVGEVVLNDPPGSHWQRPALLNVLRVTDIGEVAAALAPRRFSSLTKLPETYDFAREIYALHDASDEFGMAGSLPEALKVWRYP
ncbi:MAG: acetylxylan esterase [Verrucomicrobia bacterium]|nr:acetylxylan esterase [Verrucomicrobiota bacterium]